MPETTGILAWTLVSECPIPNDVTDLLVPGETALAAYKTFWVNLNKGIDVRRLDKLIADAVLQSGPA